MEVSLVWLKLWLTSPRLPRSLLSQVGQGLVEYSLILAMIGIAAIAFVGAFSDVLGQQLYAVGILAHMPS